MNVKKIVFLRGLQHFTARSNADDVGALEHRFVDSRKRFLSIPTVGAGDEKRMRADKLGDIVTFANGYRNGDPPKGKRFHQVGADAGATHSRNEDITDIAAGPDKIDSLTNF